MLLREREVAVAAIWFFVGGANSAVCRSRVLTFSRSQGLVVSQERPDYAIVGGRRAPPLCLVEGEGWNWRGYETQ
jgi:hypothetical protein